MGGWPARAKDLGGYVPHPQTKRGQNPRRAPPPWRPERPDSTQSVGRGLKKKKQGMVELVQKFEKFESPSSNFWALDFDVPSRLESNFCPVEGVQGVSHSLSKFDRLKIDRDPLDKQRSIELWLLRGLHRLFFAFPPSPSLKKREARVTDGVDIQNQSAHRPNHSHIPPIHPIY